MEAEKLKTYRILESGGKIFGLPTDDFYLFVMIVFLMVIIPVMLPIGLWYYPLALILLIVLYKILKYYAKKDQKNFILCFISFYLLQPKRISVILRKYNKEEEEEVKNNKE